MPESDLSTSQAWLMTGVAGFLIAKEEFADIYACTESFAKSPKPCHVAALMLIIAPIVLLVWAFDIGSHVTARGKVKHATVMPAWRVYLRMGVVIIAIMGMICGAAFLNGPK